MSKSMHYENVNGELTNNPLFKAAPHLLTALKIARDTLSELYQKAPSRDIEVTLTIADSVIKTAEKKYCAICGQVSEEDAHWECAQNQ